MFNILKLFKKKRTLKEEMETLLYITDGTPYPSIIIGEMKIQETQFSYPTYSRETSSIQEEG